MELKPYQTAALDRLGAFLERAKLTGAEAAYIHVTSGDEAVKPYVSRYRALEGLPDVPYCCIRLPTGGGKTLLGAHSIKIAADRFVERERPPVLWLTPSKTIAEQTLAALRRPGHPYRQALDDAFGGRVRVFDIGERRLVRPQDLADTVVIFVGTHQAFNVKETGDRNVYADDEAFEPHFKGAALPANLAINVDGKRAGLVANSFANLLKWHRPVLILDEAHNFVSSLSGDVKQRLNPSCVIEFTATPKPASNTIFNASARALRDADMIKLPILLTAHQTWEAAVAGAVAERRGLADKAVAEGGRYIRPITLFQAQPATAGAEVTVEKLKAHLIENVRIDPATIAVATGDTRELDGINLLDPASKIEHVITVAALKEGWDCSFAYVFCSLANIGSEGAVEQLLGRVLRQPYAERRADTALNQAYAHVSSPIFARTAEALKDQLVRMGFDAPGEAAALIVQQEATLPGGGINRDPVAFALAIDTPINVSDLSVEAQRVVRIEPRADGGVVLHIAADATPAVAALVAKVVERADTAGKAKASAIMEWQAINDARRAPAGRNVKFAPIPHFMAKVQGELELVDADTLINLAGWRLDDTSARLEPADFDFDETAQTFRFDLDGEQLSYTMAARGPELALDYGATWDAATLASWLTNALDQRDRWHSSHSVLLEFNRRVVDDLSTRRGLSLATLVRGQYLLKRAVEQRIRASRTQAAVKGLQTLFGAPDDTVVAPDHAFAFDAAINPGTGTYEGAWRPTKHFYARVGNMGGEETECAQALDTLPAVKHWVRNGDKGKHCFSLPTSTDRFHPDFVAELTDGRVLVVEYKGADRWNADTIEKDTIGRHWAARSGGRCLFVTVTKEKGRPTIMQQLEGMLAP